MSERVEQAKKERTIATRHDDDDDDAAADEDNAADANAAEATSLPRQSGSVPRNRCCATSKQQGCVRVNRGRGRQRHTKHTPRLRLRQRGRHRGTQCTPS